MYPIWLVDWAVELLGAECLAGSEANTSLRRVKPERVGGGDLPSPSEKPQRTLAYGQNDCQWSRHKERLVANSRRA